ncbi:MAG: RCC1 domain-containing protein [Kofleriaceae bacterium]
MRAIALGLVVVASSACDWVFGLERPPPPPPAWIAVAAGNAHTCAIKVDQTLWCWGENRYGETGQPATSAEILVPTQVGDGLWTAVTTGHSHTCAIDADDGLWCWGLNVASAIGVDRDDPYLPVTRVLDDVLAVAAGLAHTCAIRGDRSLWCWGENTDGQLGLAPFNDQRTPLHVATDKTWTQLSVGLHHTCAITTEQALYCWGANQFGQVAVGGGTTEFVPQLIEPTTKWIDLSTGDHHTCAIRSDGSLRCAGVNQFGQLGGGDTGTAHEVTTGPGRTWTRTFAGAGQSCALGDDLSLWCFGNNAQGQLALTEAEPEIHTPVRVGDTPEPWSTIALGGAHLCGIDAGGALWCAGSDGSGQLGSGSGGATLVPTQIDGTWSIVAVGEKSVCARDMAGMVHCWGHNAYGQLADGTVHPQQRPQFVVGGAPDGALAVGRFHACAATTGTPSVLSCWGRNDLGQVGVGASAPKAVLQVTPTSIRSPREVAAGSHTCVITVGGNLSCWGANNAGQIAKPPDEAPHPVPETGPLNQFRAISAGLEHTCGIYSISDTVRCWGSDSSGQLGHDLGPGDGEASTTMRAVKLGGSHTCGITAADGRMQCWGANADGQLGDRTSLPAQLPRPIDGAITWKTFALGSNHTCGVTEAGVTLGGELYCWGDNARGQLGDGTRMDRNEPTRIDDAADWDFVAAGGNETCARKTDGSLWCWGEDSSGQIGTGSTWSPALFAVLP